MPLLIDSLPSLLHSKAYYCIFARINTLQEDPNAPKPAKGKKTASVSSSGGGLNPLALVLLLLAIAAGVYYSQLK